MSRVFIRDALLLAVSVAAFAAVSGAEAKSDAPTLNERARGPRLVFTSNRDGDEDVYAADPSGHAVALTRNRARDNELVLAKNGKWLAVQREFSDLVLISGDGRRERRRADATPVAFSPNSRLLVFSRGLDDDRMYVVAVPRGKPRALGNGYPTASSLLSGRTLEAFSPSGRLLAFSTESDGLGVVDVVTGRRRIVPRSQFRDFVGWSPDGKHIALLRSKEKGDERIETLLVVDVRRLSSPPLELVRSGEGLQAEWLTATRIGFERSLASGGGCEVGTVSATGGSPRIVARGCFSTAWSPGPTASHTCGLLARGHRSSCSHDPTERSAKSSSRARTSPSNGHRRGGGSRLQPTTGTTTSCSSSVRTADDARALPEATLASWSQAPGRPTSATSRSQSRAAWALPRSIRRGCGASGAEPLAAAPVPGGSQARCRQRGPLRHRLRARRWRLRVCCVREVACSNSHPTAHASRRCSASRVWIAIISSRGRRAHAASFASADRSHAAITGPTTSL